MTTVYDVGGNTVTPSHYDAVRRAAGTDQLTIRVFFALNRQNGVGDTAEEIIEAKDIRSVMSVVGGEVVYSDL